MKTTTFLNVFFLRGLLAWPSMYSTVERTNYSSIQHCDRLEFFLMDSTFKKSNGQFLSIVEDTLWGEMSPFILTFFRWLLCKGINYFLLLFFTKFNSRLLTRLPNFQNYFLSRVSALLCYHLHAWLLCKKLFKKPTFSLHKTPNMKQSCI